MPHPELSIFTPKTIAFQDNTARIFPNRIPSKDLPTLKYGAKKYFPHDLNRLQYYLNKKEAVERIPVFDHVSINLDVGTTKTVFDVVGVDSKQKPISCGDKTDWFNHPTYEDKNLNFKWLDGKELMGRILERLWNHLGFLGIDPQKIETVNITTLTNTLAVVVFNKQTREWESKVILDEPSLTADFTPQEQEILKAYLGNYELRQVSSFQKLAAIYKHPEILEKMFGRKIDPAEIQITTLLGLIRHEFGGFSDYPIPQSDLLGFAMLNGKSMVDFNQLASQLNLPQIATCPDTSKSGQLEINALKDLHAEYKLLNILIAAGILPKEAIFFQTDTVGKVSILKQFIPNLAKLNGNVRSILDFAYASSRRLGGVMKDFTNLIVMNMTSLTYPHQESPINAPFVLTNEVIQKLIDQDRLNNNFWYFPENGKNGRLMFWENNKLQEIALDQVLSRCEAYKQAVVIAAIKGAFYAIWEKSEILGSNFEKAIWYGGSISRQPWQQMAAILSPMPCYWLEMESAAEAAGMVSLWENHLVPQENFINYWKNRFHLIPKPEKNIQAHEEYITWKNLRQKLPVV